MATVCPTPWLSSLKHTKPAAVRGVVAYVLRRTARANYDHPRRGARRAACVIGVIGSRPADRTLTSVVAPPRRPPARRTCCCAHWECHWQQQQQQQQPGVQHHCLTCFIPRGTFPSVCVPDDTGTVHQRCGHKRLPTVTGRCNGPQTGCQTFRI